ncbi:MAG TPA: hypothetical protein VK832_12580 [Burkholderiaceae bacterium]|jgi:hypothetical protein|nr:hypothetical protein [Burkholderiaceae bacterium]
MGFDFGNLLQQYVGGAAPAAAEVENHFDQATQGSPSSLVSQGLAAMFHSDQTPAFSQIAGQLFGQANPNQQAGMLNHLLGGMGPGVLSSLLGSAGGAGLAGVLGQLDGTNSTVTPEQAAQLTPDQVQQIADHAQQNNPEIVEHMSDFFAQHSGLIKTLGGPALTIALSKMADAHTSS